MLGLGESTSHTWFLAPKTAAFDPRLAAVDRRIKLPSQQTSNERLGLDRETAGQTMALVKPNFLHSMARVPSDREQMVTTYPARVPSAMVSGDVAMLAIVSRGEETELVGPEGGISIHKSQHPNSYSCEEYDIGKVRGGKTRGGI